MAANHRQSVTFNAAPGQILTVLRDHAFCATLNLDLKSENPSPQGVWFRFHHGATFTSWGEKITITLTAVSANATLVDVFSECGMPTQIADWGKNKQNVCNILEYIEAKVSTRAPQPAQYAQSVQYAQPVRPAAQVGVKYCFHCGKQIPQDALFCTSCGTKQS